MADDVHGEVFGEFRLPRATEVLEQLGPALQAGPLDDPKQLSPQVGIGVAVSRDDILRPRFCEVKALFQLGSQFRKKRNHTASKPALISGATR